MGVELRQLATFVAVAEEGSFTRASDRLHVVQSAVSAGVRNLERELGAPLFDRSTHKVQLTDAGRALLPEARATLAAATAARDAVDAVRGGVRGTVVLGTMQAQAMHRINLPGLPAAFRRHRGPSRPAPPVTGGCSPGRIIAPGGAAGRHVVAIERAAEPAICKHRRAPALSVRLCPGSRLAPAGAAVRNRRGDGFDTSHSTARSSAASGVRGDGLDPSYGAA